MDLLIQERELVTDKCKDIIKVQLVSPLFQWSVGDELLIGAEIKTDLSPKAHTSMRDSSPRKKLGAHCTT